MARSREREHEGCRKRERERESEGCRKRLINLERDNLGTLAVNSRNKQRELRPVNLNNPLEHQNKNKIVKECDCDCEIESLGGV